MPRGGERPVEPPGQRITPAGGRIGEPGGAASTHAGSLRRMADISTQSIAIAAPLERIAEVVSDFASYPQWVSAVKAVDVVEEYEDGYASQVHFVLDAGGLVDEYTLRYEYSEDLSRIEWSLVQPSKMQRSQHGSYDLVANGDGTTTVTYTLAVELAMPMLGMLKRKAEKKIMDTALKELKRRVETSSAQ
jgi:ribosome-associated toxin RatA of RatAB toxin-antitoxin module